MNNILQYPLCRVRENVSRTTTEIPLTNLSGIKVMDCLRIEKEHIFVARINEKNQSITAIRAFWYVFQSHKKGSPVYNLGKAEMARLMYG